MAVADYGRAHARAQAQLERTRYRLDALNKAQAASARRKELRGSMMEAVVPAMAVAAPVKMAMGFETAMADVRKVTDFDAAGLKAFGNELLDMSTRIPMTAEGLTQIAPRPVRRALRRMSCWLSPRTRRSWPPRST